MRPEDGPRILERSATSLWKESGGEVDFVEGKEFEHAPVASRAIDGVIWAGCVE